MLSSILVVRRNLRWITVVVRGLVLLNNSGIYISRNKRGDGHQMGEFILYTNKKELIRVFELYFHGYDISIDEIIPQDQR